MYFVYMEYSDVETKISLVILTVRDIRNVEYLLVNAVFIVECKILF